MISTSRLPGTVLRSSAECPCTSALGLFTRRYSAARSKRSPLSKDTVSVRRSLCSLSSVGQPSMSAIVPVSVDETDAAGGGQIEAAHFLGASGERIRAQEGEQLLQRRMEIVALVHDQIEGFP